MDYSPYISCAGMFAIACCLWGIWMALTDKYPEDAT